MIGTNVNISTEAQELLIKPAAEKQISVEKLASEILNEGINNKFAQDFNLNRASHKYASNPLANKQPYV
ncbi:hypothetical protein [Myxosarcina sp. GI1(2024)]